MEHRMGCRMEDDLTNGAGQEVAPAGSTLSDQPAPAECEQADDLKQQYDDLHDQYLRLAADFDNFRKRTARDQERIINHANEQLATDMLEIIDNLERAARSDDSHLREGLVQIQQLCATILQHHGITPVESLDKAFDPAVHEAIAHLPSRKEAGIVIDEISKGYRMHDKVIRYAKVAVSKGTTKEAEE